MTTISFQVDPMTLWWTLGGIALLSTWAINYFALILAMRWDPPNGPMDDDDHAKIGCCAALGPLCLAVILLVGCIWLMHTIFQIVGRGLVKRTLTRSAAPTPSTTIEIASQPDPEAPPDMHEELRRMLCERSNPLKEEDR